MTDSNDIIKTDTPRSEDYYNMYSSRDFYRGTSFKIAGEWTENTYYFNDVHIIDFISYKGALLYCLRSHISSEENIPKLVFDHDVVIGVEPNQFWAFILGNSGRGEKGDTGPMGPKGEPGIPGITPQLKIENGRWMLSMDNGVTWTDEGQATGADGENGLNGQDGRDGVGVISGGTTGQVLTKRSNTDYDTEWKTMSIETPSLSATVIDTQESPNAEANVVLENETFKFSFKLPRGRDGVDGTPGTDGTNGQDGLSIKIMYAKSSSDSTPPVVVKNNANPGSVWSTVIPIHSNSEFIWSITASFRNTALVGEWSDPIQMTGLPGTDGAPGATGAPGPAGKNGVDGLPGISIEIRYCLGTTISYQGTSTPGTVREPTGWSLEVPTPIEETPYIWFIQARINYLDNDDKVGTVEGSWSVPAKLSGTNGLNGTNGSKGQIIYPEGVYDVSKVYTGTTDKAPYVYDSNDANYYVLNLIGTWQGTLHNNETPSTDTSGTWVKLEAFEALYTKIGVIANGLIGSAVFNNNWMFSQQGLDINGQPSTKYENFDPQKPIGGAFTPNICLDFITGETHLAGGAVTFKDGSMEFGNVISGVENPFSWAGSLKSTYTTANNIDQQLVVDSITSTLNLGDVKIQSTCTGGASSDGLGYYGLIELTSYPSTADERVITIDTFDGVNRASITLKNKTMNEWVVVSNEYIKFCDNSEEIILTKDKLKKLLALIN